MGLNLMKNICYKLSGIAKQAVELAIEQDEASAINFSNSQIIQ